MGKQAETISLGLRVYFFGNAQGPFPEFSRLTGLVSQHDAEEKGGIARPVFADVETDSHYVWSQRLPG
jgi:hypothetical protein